MKTFTVAMASKKANLQEHQANFTRWGAGLADVDWVGYSVFDPKSITEAYNEAIDKAETPYIILTHDDAFPLQVPGYTIGQRLLSHMHGMGVLGFVGSSHLSGPVWCSAGAGRAFGTVVTNMPNNKVNALTWGQPARLVRDMRTLDGFCLVVDVEKAKEIRFDERFKWHFYDMDFCASMRKYGHNTACACDILINHQSPGRFDHAWAEGTIVFADKWQYQCDLYDPGVGGTFNTLEAGHTTALLERYKEMWSKLPDEVSLRSVFV